jgi:hypothetical protein
MLLRFAQKSEESDCESFGPQPEPGAVATGSRFG